MRASAPRARARKVSLPSRNARLLSVGEIFDNSELRQPRPAGVQYEVEYVIRGLGSFKTRTHPRALRDARPYPLGGSLHARLERQHLDRCDRRFPCPTLFRRRQLDARPAEADRPAV